MCGQVDVGDIDGVRGDFWGADNMVFLALGGGRMGAHFVDAYLCFVSRRYLR